MSSHRKRSRGTGSTRALRNTRRGSTAQLPQPVPVDRWGYHYECISFAAPGSSDQREFHNFPINGGHDSRSQGPDGWTDHDVGHNDNVRGPDGDFIGTARDF